MAKAKNRLSDAPPPAEEPTTETVATAELPETEAAASARSETVEVQQHFADVSLPLGAIRWCELQPRHIELQLTQRQALALKRLYEGVNGQEMRTGRRVSTPANAVQFVLDLLADAQEQIDWTEEDEPAE